MSIVETSLGTFTQRGEPCVVGSKVIFQSGGTLQVCETSTGSLVTIVTHLYTYNEFIYWVSDYGVAYTNGFLVAAAGKPDDANVILKSFAFDSVTGEVTDAQTLTFNPPGPWERQKVLGLYAGPDGVIFAVISSRYGYNITVAINVDAEGNMTVGDDTYRSGSADNKVQRVFWDGEYLYAAEGSYGVRVYSFTEGVFTQVAEHVVADATCPDMTNMTGYEAFAICVSAIANNVFVGTEGLSDNGLVFAFSFDGSSLTYVAHHQLVDRVLGGGQGADAYAMGVVENTVIVQGRGEIIGLTLGLSGFTDQFHKTTYSADIFGYGIDEVFLSTYDEQEDDASRGYLYTINSVPVLPVLAQPVSTLFVPVNSAKAFVIGSKQTDDVPTTKLQITNYKGRSDYQDVLKNGG
jgi:hypothetical protein